MNKLLIPIIFLLLSGCAITNTSTEIEVNDETNGFVEFTYKMAKSANLALLHQKQLAKNSKEIRVWIGFGLVTPEEALIFEIDNENVSGKKLYLFDASPNRWEGSEELLAEALEDLSLTCSPLSSYKGYKSCELVKNKFYDWNKIYKELIKLDIWNLPDESKLPEPEIIVNDGIGMVVELREGNKYRTYYYGNPGFRNQKEAQQASKIMSLLMNI